MLFSIVAARVHIPTSSVRVSLFSTSLPTFVICVRFDGSCSDKCNVISSCGFDLVISVMISEVEHLFLSLLAIFVSSSEKMSVQVFCPFLKLAFVVVWKDLAFDWGVGSTTP